MAWVSRHAHMLWKWCSHPGSPFGSIYPVWPRCNQSYLDPWPASQCSSPFLARCGDHVDLSQGVCCGGCCSSCRPRQPRSLPSWPDVTARMVPDRWPPWGHHLGSYSQAQPLWDCLPVAGTSWLVLVCWHLQPPARKRWTGHAHLPEDPSRPGHDLVEWWSCPPSLEDFVWCLWLPILWQCNAWRACENGASWLLVGIAKDLPGDGATDEMLLCAMCMVLHGLGYACLLLWSARALLCRGFECSGLQALSSLWAASDEQQVLLGSWPSLPWTFVGWVAEPVKLSDANLQDWEFWFSTLALGQRDLLRTYQSVYAPNLVITRIERKAKKVSQLVWPTVVLFFLPAARPPCLPVCVSNCWDRKMLIQSTLPRYLYLQVYAGAIYFLNQIHHIWAVAKTLWKFVILAQCFRRIFREAYAMQVLAFVELMSSILLSRRFRLSRRVFLLHVWFSLSLTLCFSVLVALLTTAALIYCTSQE